MEDKTRKPIYKHKDSSAIYFICGLALGLLPWGLNLIGVTLNVFLGALILVVAFGLMVKAFWMWRASSRWHSFFRMLIIMCAGVLYFGLVGNQVMTELKKMYKTEVTRYRVDHLPPEKPKTEKSEKKHAHAFLQVRQVAPVGGRIAVGEKLAFNVYWDNVGPGRVFDILTLSKLYMVENPGDSSDMDVRRRFYEWMTPWNKKYLSGKIQSKDQLSIGNHVWQSVFTEPITENQFKGLFDGSVRIYVVSYCSWKDDEGTRDFVFDCEWLQAFPKFEGRAYQPSDLVWHSCAIIK